ncbi:hypothetical protein [Streptomyces sp. NBC_00443]|uniref:hypothetical protein n=1 Tax=Streptomyces sp. NBC_00443 TaxID=2975743 RepID=UPI002E1F1903
MTQDIGAPPRKPIAGSVAADRLAEALGTPNQAGERADVAAFMVLRLIAPVLRESGSSPAGGRAVAGTHTLTHQR